ncbi:MAG: two-component regulator propeller domain-containing protein [Bacteroidales bacterium]|nr:two-component regulator propeller domain-containing protein [Bacteroidales bacterium]
MTRYLLLLIGLLLCSAGLAAQDDYLPFKRITINDGLSLSSVYHIYQDSKGFMWFGTEDGLNKYDGQNITVYGAHTDQHNLLADKWIELIFEDKSGVIWLGSKSGLTRYNPRTGMFTALKHDPKNISSLSNDTITAIEADLRNEIWVGTFRGLNHVDRFSREVQRVVPDDQELVGLSSRISGFLNDKSGRFWISTYKGLYSYDRKSGLFFSENRDGPIDTSTSIYDMALRDETLWLGTDRGLVKLDLSPDRRSQLIALNFAGENARITRVLPDYLGQVWILTGEGLYCYRKEEDDLQLFLSTGGSTHSLATDPRESLLEDLTGDIWFGTFGNGVFWIDPENFSYRHYMHNPADPESLSDNSINCVFQDRSGATWFGTFGAGISVMNPHSNRFTLFKNNPFNPNSLASSFIWTICEASDSTLWMGTNAHGISCYDQRRGTYTHYDHNPLEPGSLAHSSIRKIYQDSRGRIWIGTDGGGLNLFHPDKRSFTHFRHDPGNPASLSHNSVRAVFEDREGRIWVGTRNGLNLLLEDQKSFRRYLTAAAQETGPPHNFIYSAIHQDKNDKLWVGTYGGGLCRLNPEDGSCISYFYDPEDPNSISDNIVFSIYEDPQERFWIGTNSGLNMFYPATGTFRRFGVNEGLANEVIYGVLPDNNNCIWLSTNLGICRFDLETFEVRNFDMNDGLQSNEFNGGSFYRGPSGKLYFGGVYGMNIVDPETLEPVTNVPEFTLTSLEVLGKEVRIGGIDLEEEFEGQPERIVESDGNFYSSENVSYMEEIVLDYRHRFFSVEFAALNNLQTGDLHYSYIMENLDTDWNNAGSRNYVSYTNMKAGNYLLKVVAENTDGYRSDPPLQLSILITPPIWLSWWFILLEILVSVSIAVWIYIYLLKSRTNRLLKHQNQQISELMVESFDDTEREDHKAGFMKINQSVKHLLDLLENLLTWSRSQRGRIKYDPVKFNLSSLVQENINLHRLLAEKKGIMLHASEQDEVYAYGDRDMINSVIRNLVTNAVKFTNRDKKVEIQLKPRKEEIEVSIVDEGIGISPEQMEKLFRIDEKFKSTGTAGEKGTGLGLIICREFVEKNGGEIKVESSPGKGSVFSFTVPMAN